MERDRASETPRTKTRADALLLNNGYRDQHAGSPIVPGAATTRRKAYKRAELFPRRQKKAVDEERKAAERNPVWPQGKTDVALHAFQRYLVFCVEHEGWPVKKSDKGPEKKDAIDVFNYSKAKQRSKLSAGAAQVLDEIHELKRAPALPTSELKRAAERILRKHFADPGLATESGRPASSSADLFPAQPGGDDVAAIESAVAAMTLSDPADRTGRQ